MNPGKEQREAANDDNTYVNRDLIDFDPDEGLLSGTAIEGTSDIPGPHEQGDDRAEDPDHPSGDAQHEPRQHAEDQ